MNFKSRLRILFSEAKSAWIVAFKDIAFRKEFFITVLCLYGLMIFSQLFFFRMEQRAGTVWNDVFLNLLPPCNVSWIIFSTIYLSTLVVLGYLFFFPIRMVVAIQAYIFLTAMRLAFIYILPLNPPAGMLLLADPLLDYFVYDDNVITKDLFFSGHTSSVFLFFLLVRGRMLNYIMLAATGLVAFLILLQHAHYTADVVAAPFFSWFALSVVKYVRRLRTRSHTIRVSDSQNHSLF